LTDAAGFGIIRLENAVRKEVESMQYIGVPTCPYCKKRVNLIRTWSLKKQGEYRCPRCGGISNIYLSPLIYVLALLALFAGGAVYFFHKFVLDDVGLETALQVFLPFAGFFLFSVFFVYLAKPVIKRVSREDKGGKKRGRKAGPAAGPLDQTGHVYYDREDYPLQREQFTTTIPPQAPPRAAAPQAAAPIRQPRPAEPYPEAQQPLSHRLDAAAAPRQQAPAPPRPAAVRQASPTPRQQSTTVIRPPVPVSRRPARPSAPAAQPGAGPQAAQVVSSVEPPEAADDFFAKYDDPDYVQRRLREINGK